MSNESLYKVITANNKFDLSENLYEYLVKDWVCQGGVFISNNEKFPGGHGILYAQAIIKIKESNNET